MRRTALSGAQPGSAPDFDPWDVAESSADRHDRLIPMINIVFLLLAFFLIAGTFRAAETLTIDPPFASSEGELDAGALTVFIDADASFALAGKRVTRQRLLAEAGAWLAEHPDGELQIKADRALRAGALLPLLLDLQKAGARSVRLVANRREDHL